jgi:hypothetical protein
LVHCSRIGENPTLDSTGGPNCPETAKSVLTNPDGRQRQTTATFDKFLANCFFGGGPAKGKSENRRIFIGDLMVGLGGLEPPTAPLSGAFMVLYA